jgi:hypothetical protein
MERSTVVGVFTDRSSAERAIDELHRMGFNDDSIGFAMKGEQGTTTTEHHDDGNPEHATSGMVAGAGLGAIAAAAALLIPGVGPVLAGGILSTLIGGAAAGGAVGGLVGMLTGMGVSDDEAHYYESEFNSGRILVTVRAGTRWAEAQQILRSSGAYDVENRRAA